MDDRVLFVDLTGAEQQLVLAIADALSKICVGLVQDTGVPLPRGAELMPRAEILNLVSGIWAPHEQGLGERDALGEDICMLIRSAVAEMSLQTEREGDA